MIRSIRPDILIHRDSFTTDSAYMREEDSTALDRGLPHWQLLVRAVEARARLIPVTGSQTATWILSTSPSGSISFPPHSTRWRLAQGFAKAAARTITSSAVSTTREDKSAQARVREMFASTVTTKSCSTALSPVPCGDRPAGIARRAHDARVPRLVPRADGGHFPFDAIFDSRMEAVGLARYTTLILPDDRYMSDSRAALIDSFVAKGGTVIATGETGFYDVHYERREKPALSCLGVERCLNVATTRADRTSKFRRKTRCRASRRRATRRPRRRLPFL
jgi:hypothetical protein